MTLQSAAGELSDTVRQFVPRFSAISDIDIQAKPDPTKWSRQEVIGHLIDSAQNNLRRFITVQYELNPPHVVYDQDLWVIFNHYNAMPSSDVIQLWRLLNERISAVLVQMPADQGDKFCNTSRTSVNLVTVKWMAQDYVVHLKHHINQVIPGSFDVHYPPQ
ncbi:MAG: DinB family protein [Chryseolinea sp.]